MILDSSALLAILLAEPDAARYAAKISVTADVRMPGPTWVEAALVIESRADAVLTERFDSYLTEMGIRIMPFEPRHAVAARLAWSRYGRGRHPEKLNFGDCMAYGFAKAEGLPLLFKGGDFPLTDIDPALKD